MLQRFDRVRGWIGGWLLALPPRRLLYQTLILSITLNLLAIPFLLVETGGTDTLGVIAIASFVLAYGALRLRVSRVPARQALVSEGMAAASQLAIVLPAILFFIVTDIGISNAGWLVALLITAGMLGVGYGSLRLMVLIAYRWEQVRQKRLRWAFVHSTLVSMLLVAFPLLLFMLLVILSRFFTDSSLALGSLSELYLSSMRVAFSILLPIFLWAVAVVAMLLVLLLPSTLVASIFARQTTRRLDALATMADRLRDGDLSARVRIQGQDEVARFQQDFNMMAESLERAMREVRAERERVEGLLTQRRELVASVSHELRTPLSVLHGQLEQMQVAPEGHGRVELLLRESEQLARIVDDLFTLSRAEVGKLTLRLEPTDVAEVVRHCVQATAATAWQQRRVEVVADLPGGMPPALADRDRLTQILYNLLHNAIRHTGPGGIVAVSGESDADSVHLHVRDTGEGIPADAIPHIWEPFYRADPTSSGTGLGLPLVRHLADAMGGSATVESAVGEGSVFTLTLPRAG